MTAHAKISYIKSMIRIFGFLFLVQNVYVAALVLIFAEILGIIEERGL